MPKLLSITNRLDNSQFIANIFYEQKIVEKESKSITNMGHLTSKCRIYITEFKANIPTPYNCYPIGNRFQFECMVTGNHSLPWKRELEFFINKLSRPIKHEKKSRDGEKMIQHL